MDMILNTHHDKARISEDAKFFAELGALAVASLLISVLLA